MHMHENQIEYQTQGGIWIELGFVLLLADRIAQVFAPMLDYFG